MNPLRSILNKYKKPIYQEGGSLTSGGTDEVQKYQRFLNDKYDAGLVEDGAWGPKTQKAYEKFVLSQKAAAPKTAAPTNAPVTPSKKQAPIASKPTSKPAAAPVKKESPRFPFENSMLVPRVGQTPVSTSKKVEEKPVQRPAQKPVVKPTVKPTTATATNWPSLSDLPKAKTPAKVETKTTKTVAKPVAKLNPENVRIPIFGNPVLDRRQIPQTGVVIDRGTNEAYVLGNKKAYSYPVLTGMSNDPMANENMYTTKQIEKIGKKAKVTPTGYYIMDKDNVSENDKKHYQGNIRSLNPISAYGLPAPKAANTAFHQTANPAYRNQFYSQGPEQRRQSYACTNAQGQNICRTFRDVADKDTALIIDSRLPSDRKLLEKARKRTGYKLGGKASSFKSKLKQVYSNKYK